MKRFSMLVIMFVCFSLAAFAADVPKGDVFGGFTIDHSKKTGVGLTTYGFQTSLAGNINKMVGIVADFAGEYKTVSAVKKTNYQLLFGPRANVWHMDRFSTFVEALYGINRVRSGPKVNKGFAMAYGGGVDINAAKNINIRAFQVDWLPYRINTGTSKSWTKNNVRYSFGVDYLLGKK